MPRGCVRSENCGIYAIVNTTNGKVYIGQSTDIPKRFSTHMLQLSRRKHDNQHLQSAYNLQGVEAFKLTILTLCGRRDLNIQEQAWIDFYVSWDNLYGYNKERYVTGNGPLSDETKRRISAAHQTNGRLRGRTLTEEHRRKIREASNTGEHTHARVMLCKNRVWTQESRDKIRESKIGRKATEEDRLSMSKAHLGIPFSEERRERVGDTVRGTWAKMTPEQRAQRQRKVWETRRRNAANKAGGG